MHCYRLCNFQIHYTFIEIMIVRSSMFCFGWKQTFFVYMEERERDNVYQYQNLKKRINYSFVGAEYPDSLTQFYS